MSPKITNKGSGQQIDQQAKEAARQCLLLADKFLKDSNFEKARSEIEKAEKLDPSNVYIYAFKDRINHFEQENKKSEPGAKPAPAPPEQKPVTPQQAQPAKVPPPPPTPTTEKKPAPPKPPAQPPVAPKPPAAQQNKPVAPPPKPELQTQKPPARTVPAPPSQARSKDDQPTKPTAMPKMPEPPKAPPPQEPGQLREAPPPRQKAPEPEEEDRASDIQKRFQSELAAAMEKRKQEHGGGGRRDKEQAEREARQQRERDAAFAAEQEKIRQQHEDLVAAAEAKRLEKEQRANQERKKTEREEPRRPVVDDEKIRQVIEKVSAEEMRKREEESARQKEAEEKQRELVERLKQEEQKRKEIESRVADDEKRRKELEELASQTARERQELERLQAEERERRAREAAMTPDPSAVGEQQKKLEEMRRQVEELTSALQQEKKAREEIKKQHLDSAVQQLRAAMRKAWVHGAPTDDEATELRDLAQTLTIPSEVEQSIQREIKLEMYSNAVKEVIGKKKLWRSSSNTLEWLRKVYQVSMAEYLENESKFLLDLMADQYRGTVLLVMNTEDVRQDLAGKLKASGFAVVQAASAEEALEKIEKINPNFVLSQVTFGPGELSGVKFLHLLRVNPKINFVPFVFLGEESEEEIVSQTDLRPNEGFVDISADFADVMHIMNEKMEAFRNYISSLS